MDAFRALLAPLFKGLRMRLTRLGLPLIGLVLQLVGLRIRRI